MSLNRIGKGSWRAVVAAGSKSQGLPPKLNGVTFSNHIAIRVPCVCLNNSDFELTVGELYSITAYAQTVTRQGANEIELVAVRVESIQT